MVSLSFQTVFRFSRRKLLVTALSHLLMLSVSSCAGHSSVPSATSEYSCAGNPEDQNDPRSASDKTRDNRNSTQGKKANPQVYCPPKPPKDFPSTDREFQQERGNGHPTGPVPFGIPQTPPK